MKACRVLLNELISGKISINDILEYKSEFLVLAEKIINKRSNVTEIESFLKICLNVYYYSDEGDVMIPDRTYDLCMQVYTSLGKEVIVYPDRIKGISLTMWDLKPHTHMGLVGTIEKVYEYKEVKKWYEYMNETRFAVSPKLDGVSCSIKVENGKLVEALTRYRGDEGQDISDVIIRSSNIKELIKKNPNCYMKCEIVMKTSDFEELCKEKTYTNRRSAVSGIVSTPKNVDKGKYLTIVPLLYLYEKEDGDEVSFNLSLNEIHEFYSARDLFDYVEKSLEQIKDTHEYRLDGIVITPIFSMKNMRNTLDYYSDSVAFKVNTSEAKTNILYGYMSIGRLGTATPMLKVRDVEVNETNVTDVSLGSYANFLKMDLVENEEIIIYSAGDVIPQVKLLDHRNNLYRENYLDIPTICPHCNEKLTRISTEYICDNKNCVRVQSGKIANFAIKLGIEGFSDETFAKLYEADIITGIVDLLEVEKYHKILSEMEGFGERSINNLEEEIKRIKSSPVPVSKFFGALGIPAISDKKCKKIFEMVDINFVLNNHARNIAEHILCIKGIGAVTADMFANFVVSNRVYIQKIVSMMNIVNDAMSYGNIVFTGFRSKEYEEKLEMLGYELSNSINENTKALVYANSNSTKYERAMRKQIPVYAYDEFSELLKDIQS